MQTAVISGKTRPSAPRTNGRGFVGDVSWERMIRAVEKVRERLRRAVAALEARACLTRWQAETPWVDRVPSELAGRLQNLLDTPEG